MKQAELRGSHRQVCFGFSDILTALLRLLPVQHYSCECWLWQQLNQCQTLPQSRDGYLSKKHTKAFAHMHELAGNKCGSSSRRVFRRREHEPGRPRGSVGHAAAPATCLCCRGSAGALDGVLGTHSARSCSKLFCWEL